MNSESFFKKVQSYVELSPLSMASWRTILRPEVRKRGEPFVAMGQIPKRVGFVEEGLLSQEYVSVTGESTIKYFFPEGRFAASAGAMLTTTPSSFSIVALEDSRLISYDFAKFKQLAERHSDISTFYVRYMELHWIVEKEPLEISFRHDNAPARYQRLLETYPGLVPRLKKHQIASYLGITPTQLSRIFASAK